MSNLSSFEINFYVYDSSGKPQTVLLSSQPQVPSPETKSNINTTIEELKTYLSTNNITLKNLPLVKSEVQSISGNINGNELYSSDVQTLASQLESNISSSTNLQQMLTQLQTKIQSSTVTTGTVPVTPENDSTTSPSAYMSSIQTKKYSTPQTTVTSSSTVGSKIKGLSDNQNTYNTNMTTFLTKVKSTFNNLLTNKNIKDRQSGTQNADTILSNILGEQSSSNAKPGTVQNNVFNNIVKSFVGDGTVRQRGGGRKPIINKKNTTTTTTTTNPNADLNAYQIPKASTIENSDSTVTSTSDYYQITSIQSNDRIMVTFLYFVGGSSQSTKSFVFYLNPGSLLFLSNNAYNEVCKLNSQMKTNICNNVGYTPASGSPTNQDLWCCYLIWLFSYVSFGVSTQLYPSEYYISFPTNIIGGNAYNYMLGYNYMEHVGNFGMTCQMFNMNSEQQTFIKIAIPSIWPHLMYSFDNKPKCYYGYIASSINNTLKQQISTNTTSS